MCLSKHVSVLQTDLTFLDFSDLHSKISSEVFLGGNFVENSSTERFLIVGNLRTLVVSATSLSCKSVVCLVLEAGVHVLVLPL